MKMIRNGLSPGMKHTDKSGPALKLGSSWLLQHWGKYKMETGGRPQLGLPVNQPFLLGDCLAFWTMPVPA